VDTTTLALIVATAVGSVAVLGQALAQRGQHRLEEAQAHLQQADAWKSLQSDWVHCLLIAQGHAPGVSEWQVKQLADLVEKFREADLRWLSLNEPGEVDQDDYDKLIRESREAYDALDPYRASVQRVIIHLAQLASLVLRKRISIATVYDAIGYDLLSLGDQIRPLVSLPYGSDSGCVAPTNMEKDYWRTAEQHEVIHRVGWYYSPGLRCRWASKRSGSPAGG
jgi:hypothetical protein